MPENKPVKNQNQAQNDFGTKQVKRFHNIVCNILDKTFHFSRIEEIREEKVCIFWGWRNHCCQPLH